MNVITYKEVSSFMRTILFQVLRIMYLQLVSVWSIKYGVQFSLDLTCTIMYVNT